MENTNENLKETPKQTIINDYDSSPRQKAIKSKYTLNEFIKIQNGEKTRFNFAAFLFGPIYCLYKRNMKTFSLYFAFPICAFIFIQAYFIIFKMDTLANEELLSDLIMINFITIFTMFVIRILVGSQFNIQYFEYCKMDKDNFRSEHSKKISSFIIAYASYILIWVCSIVLIIGCIATSLDIGSIEFGNGVVVNNIYQNESLNFQAVSTEELTVLSQEEFDEKFKGNQAGDIEAYICNEDNTKNATIYTASTNFLNLTQDEYMNLIIENNYQNKYKNINKELLQTLQIGGCDFYIYNLMYGDDVNTYTDYHLIQLVKNGAFIIHVTGSDFDSVQEVIHCFCSLK